MCPSALLVTAVTIGVRKTRAARPILLPFSSVNQSAPSGPVVIPTGSLFVVGIAYSLSSPAIVIRPILLPFSSANHTAPSDPAVMPEGPALLDVVYSVTTPPVVIRPILLPASSVNQSAPSGPAVMP